MAEQKFKKFRPLNEVKADQKPKYEVKAPNFDGVMDEMDYLINKDNLEKNYKQTSAE